MKLTKTCARFLRKHGGTILAVAASVGVVATAIETGRASAKAQKIIEKNAIAIDCENYGKSCYTTKQKVLDCWKVYVPAAILGGGTIACILGSNALNKKQIAGLTAAYMALGKTYQEYRRQVAEHVGAEYEKEIYKDAQSALKEPTSNMVEDKLLCYEPISERYFHATKAELLNAFYEVNHDFATNGYIALNDFYGYLNLDFVPALNDRGWSMDYLGAMWENYWIDFSYVRQQTDDGLEVYYVSAFQEPIENYLNYDPYEGLYDKAIEKVKNELPF